MVLKSYRSKFDEAGIHDLSCMRLMERTQLTLPQTHDTVAIILFVSGDPYKRTNPPITKPTNTMKHLGMQGVCFRWAGEWVMLDWDGGVVGSGMRGSVYR